MQVFRYITEYLAIVFSIILIFPLLFVLGAGSSDEILFYRGLAISKYFAHALSPFVRIKEHIYSGNVLERRGFVELSQRGKHFFIW
jgi:hypothetical protein